LKTNLLKTKCLISILFSIVIFLFQGCSNPFAANYPKSQSYYQNLPLPVLEKSENCILYTVYPSDPQNGILKIEADYPAVGKKVIFKGGKKGEHDIVQISFTDDSGQDIPHNKDKENNKFTTKTEVDGNVHLTYRMKIGGLGRHGHQGYFDNRFLSFDGRIFLLPAGRKHIYNIQVRFASPSHPGSQTHRIITPWQPTTDPRTFRVFDYQDQKHLFTSLKKSLGAIGPFVEHKETIGRTNVEVYTYTHWENDFKDELVNNSIKLFKYFNERFDYNVEGPFQFVWTPPSQENRRIWSAVWSNGMCYEMKPGKEAAIRRNWELVGHRIGHPINEYEPYGIHFADNDERFFLEGWASYIELKAVEETKIFDPEYRWERKYQDYLRKIMQDFDRKLSKERKIKDKDVKEFIHYTKSPLVVMLLAMEVTKLTNGQKTLEDFMAYLYPKYRDNNQKAPLKKELKNFTGHDFNPFWDRYVRTKRILLPLWRSPKGKYSPENTTISMFDLLSDSYSVFSPIDNAKEAAFDLAFSRYFTNEILDVNQNPFKNYLADIPTAIQKKYFKLEIDKFYDEKIIPNWRSENDVHIKEQTVAPEIENIFNKLQQARQKSTTSFDKEYIKEIKIGNPPKNKDVHVNTEKQIFIGGKKASPKRLSTNIYWNKDSFDATYKVYYKGEKVFEKTRLVEPGWTVSLINYSLSDGSKKNGIFKDEGLYTVEISSKDEKDKKIGEFSFFLIQPPKNISYSKNIPKKLSKDEFLAYYTSSPPDMVQDYNKMIDDLVLKKVAMLTDLVELRPISKYVKNVKYLHRADFNRRLKRGIIKSWVKTQDFKLNIEKIIERLSAIKTKLDQEEEFIDKDYLRGIKFTGKSYNNQTKSHKVFPLKKKISLITNFKKDSKHKLQYSLKDKAGSIYYTETLDISKKLKQYTVLLETEKIEQEGIYFVEVVDKESKNTILSRPLYFFKSEAF